MNRIFQRITVGIGALVIISLTSCAANPKKKCDTCPKWRSEMPSVDHQLPSKA